MCRCHAIRRHDKAFYISVTRYSRKVESADSLYRDTMVDVHRGFSIMLDVFFGGYYILLFYSALCSMISLVMKVVSEQISKLGKFKKSSFLCCRCLYIAPFVTDVLLKQFRWKQGQNYKNVLVCHILISGGKHYFTFYASPARIVVGVEHSGANVFGDFNEWCFCCCLLIFSTLCTPTTATTPVE